MCGEILMRNPTGTISLENELRLFETRSGRIYINVNGLYLKNINSVYIAVPLFMFDIYDNSVTIGLESLKRFGIVTNIERIIVEGKRCNTSGKIIGCCASTC
jgi:hypothetical protein